MKRKGVLTPDQEKQLDDLIELKGFMEVVDGPAIRIADNKGIEALKSKIPEEFHEVIYGIVDELFDLLPKKK